MPCMIIGISEHLLLLGTPGGHGELDSSQSMTPAGNSFHGVFAYSNKMALPYLFSYSVLSRLLQFLLYFALLMLLYYCIACGSDDRILQYGSV